MKRLFLMIALVTAAWVISTRHARMNHGPRPNPTARTTTVVVRGDKVNIHHPHAKVVVSSESDDEEDVEDIKAGQEEAREHLDEVRVAMREAQDEVRRASEELNRAKADVRRVMGEVADEIRQSVDGIPVPIVPGTEVTEAVTEPPAPPRPPATLAPPAPPTRASRPKFIFRPFKRPEPPKPPEPPVEPRTVTGQISATEERARADARRQLEQEVTAWIDPEVPHTWKPSPRQIDAMVVETKVSPVVKPYGTLYVAELQSDFSPRRRAEVIGTYERQLVNRRLVLLGGGLGFVLTCLAILSGYIRTDEATKGYYTNRLRLLAAGGLGAAGALIYQLVA